LAIQTLTKKQASTRRMQNERQRRTKEPQIAEERKGRDGTATVDYPA
jgi:hypothetical protein